LNGGGGVQKAYCCAIDAERENVNGKHELAQAPDDCHAKTKKNRPKAVFIDTTYYFDALAM
jgi:hypothetical protein